MVGGVIEVKQVGVTAGALTVGLAAIGGINLYLDMTKSCERAVNMHPGRRIPSRLCCLLRQAAVPVR